ncbi:hypothetical protein [Foetidibacter luteolus]|uniref:hypothetical protein n=1 Tax=Foetidibacter luteolus TaxID=2608880 RepID=UPI00129A7830|nr:hypothetical protein [Foetidibacter luteolus]
MSFQRNRDLLVLTKSFTKNPEEFEHEVELLHGLLYHAETMDVFCLANEVVDVNRYKIIHQPPVIWQTAQAKTLKPFVFINCRN